MDKPHSRDLDSLLTHRLISRGGKANCDGGMHDPGTMCSSLQNTIKETPMAVIAGNAPVPAVCIDSVAATAWECEGVAPRTS